MNDVTLRTQNEVTLRTQVVASWRVKTSSKRSRGPFVARESRRRDLGPGCPTKIPIGSIAGRPRAEARTRAPERLPRDPRHGPRRRSRRHEHRPWDLFGMSLISLAQGDRSQFVCGEEIVGLLVRLLRHPSRSALLGRLVLRER
jgi:hypothetical protein